VLALTSCVNKGVKKDAKKVGITKVFLKPMTFQTYEGFILKNYYVPDLNKKR